MFFFRRKRKPSLMKRLFYLLVLLTGGGGLGGAYFKDHPLVQQLLSQFSSGQAPQNLNQLESAVVADVEKAVGVPDPFAQPGTFEVTISKVELDPKLFPPGHTLDIQARVVKLESSGQDETVFETKPFGERLATAGRDDLSTGWPYRPFHVAWRPGQAIVVEVYDRLTGFFVPPTRFVLAPAESEPREFPLKSGTFTLKPARRPPRGQTPTNDSRIVLESKRLDDPHSSPSSTATALRPDAQTIR